VLGGQWFDAWEPLLAYLRRHAPAIARRVRAVEQARAAFVAAEAQGSPAAVEVARRALRSATERLAGNRSKLQGMLAEIYVTHWKTWRDQVEAYRDLAEAEIAHRPGRWEVRPVAGDLRLDGKEVWDEAILLVRTDVDPGLAEIFLAAQFKAEKQDTALEQVLHDAAREFRPGKRTSTPVVTWRE
jgi:hypothetical protein